MKRKTIVYVLFLGIVFCGCVNKKTTEDGKAAESENNIENNTTSENNNPGYFSINEKVYVASFDGLNLRSNYGINGAKILLLPHNTELTILERSKEKETIDKINDYWYKVDTGNETGWVFGGYLFHKPVNDKIKNIEIAKMIAEMGDFWNGGNIMSLKGGIEYINKDTLIIYDTTSKESRYFLTEQKNIFLIKLEENPGWLYAISPDYEIQGYVYVYDISEKSFYGNLEGNIPIEYQILKQHQNIKRYGPLLSINHNGKDIEFWDTRSGPGLTGHRYLLSDYYPKFNEILITRIWWEGWEKYIYNLEYEEYRCERIENPYFNNTRTALLSLIFSEDLGRFIEYNLVVFKIDKGFYEKIYNKSFTINDRESTIDILWINDNEARIDFGEAGNVLVEMGDEIKIVNNLVPLTWE